MDKDLLLIEILVTLENEMEEILRLVQPLEDPVQRYHDLREKILTLRQLYCV